MAVLCHDPVGFAKRLKVAEVCTQLGIGQQTCCGWLRKYGGMPPALAKHLSGLGKEDALLVPFVQRVPRLWQAQKQFLAQWLPQQSAILVLPGAPCPYQPVEEGRLTAVI